MLAGAVRAAGSMRGRARNLERRSGPMLVSRTWAGVSWAGSAGAGVPSLMETCGLMGLSGSGMCSSNSRAALRSMVPAARGDWGSAACAAELRLCGRAATSATSSTEAIRLTPAAPKRRAPARSSRRLGRGAVVAGGAAAAAAAWRNCRLRGAATR